MRQANERMKRNIKKTCEFCGSEYMAAYKNTKYCQDLRCLERRKYVGRLRRQGKKPAGEWVFPVD